MEPTPGNGKLLPVSNRKYTQLSVLDDLGLLVSISGILLTYSKLGKYKVISLHDISSLPNPEKVRRFESQTKLTKLKETATCEFYQIGILFKLKIQ